ncbi:MAG: GcrA family cell cycle regulator [Beijerinckiaceae bacterium]
MSWTDERVEQLRKLWMDGLSASQIANTLGSGITRNAVIGKVHRLGLSGRVKAPSSSKPRVRSSQPRQSRVQRRPGGGGAVHGNTALAYQARPYVQPVARALEEIVVPMSNPVTIMDLKESMCRFPLGDPQTPEFRYCGGKSETGIPYCPFHTRIAYQPAQDRRRERDRERRAQMRAIAS